MQMTWRLAHVFGCDAGSVVDSIKLAGTVLWEGFTAAGFRVNWGPKKTACMIRWNGKAMGHARALLEQELDSKVPLDLGESLLSFIVRDYTSIWDQSR